jgi:hypothetical protein
MNILDFIGPKIQSVATKATMDNLGMNEENCGAGRGVNVAKGYCL